MRDIAVKGVTINEYHMLLLMFYRNNNEDNFYLYNTSMALDNLYALMIYT